MDGMTVSGKEKKTSYRARGLANSISQNNVGFGVALGFMLIRVASKP